MGGLSKKGWGGGGGAWQERVGGVFEELIPQRTLYHVGKRYKLCITKICIFQKIRLGIFSNFPKFSEKVTYFSP